MSGGIKFDAGKVRFDLLPREVLAGAAAVMTFGAAKYEPYNWQGVELHRYLSAMERHLAAMVVDPQGLDDGEGGSGLAHAFHFATNALFIAWLALNKPEQFKRYCYQQDGLACPLA